MSPDERIAWKALLALGATVTTVDGRDALDLRSIPITSAPQMVLFCRALVDLLRLHRGRGSTLIVSDEEPIS